jgi:hypothetical protein
MRPLHAGLASGRWQTMTLATQLGNVGSEYERALNWQKRGDAAHFENAFVRMLELLDLTITDQRWKNHRLKELVRLREVICEEFCGENNEVRDSRDLRQYFLYFGILARSLADESV